MGPETLQDFQFLQLCKLNVCYSIVECFNLLAENSYLPFDANDC